MHLTIIAAVFPVIFLGELPDKSMFASLILATKGKPLSVWIGAAAAFLVHVLIATTIGVGLFRLLPPRAVDAVVAVLFAGGAIYAWRQAAEEDELVEREASAHAVVTTAFLVIFVAEWGDLTQILIANMAAHYHSALSVSIGASLALWSVAGLAVAGGQSVLKWVKVSTVRRVTSGVLVLLAGYSAWSAVR